MAEAEMDFNLFLRCGVYDLDFNLKNQEQLNGFKKILVNWINDASLVGKEVKYKYYIGAKPVIGSLSIESMLDAIKKFSLLSEKILEG